MTILQKANDRLANYHRILKAAESDGYKPGQVITVLSTATAVVCPNRYNIDGAKLTRYRLQWSQDGRALIWKHVCSYRKRPAYVFSVNDYDAHFRSLKRYE